MKGGKSDEIKTAPTRTFQMPGKPGMKGGSMGGKQLQGKRDETCGTKGAAGGGYSKNC